MISQKVLPSLDNDMRDRLVVTQIDSSFTNMFVLQWTALRGVVDARGVSRLLEHWRNKILRVVAVAIPT